jgi:hypothetical protein
MELITISLYLLFCFLVGKYAENKGLPFARGFFISVLLSPLLGAIIIGFMKSPKK